MKTVYLIRHAQSRPTAELEDPEWPLSEKGVSQALRLVALLERLGIDEVHTSPYRRCRHTIAPFIDSAGVPLHRHHDLRERRVAPTIIDNFAEVWRRSWEDFSFALPGCETSHAAQGRVFAAVSSICEQSQASALAISSHGNALSLLLNHIDSSFGVERATAMRNPDMFRMIFRDRTLIWDDRWSAPELDEFSSHHSDTPFPKR